MARTTKSSRNAARFSVRRRWALLGLAAFLLVDVLLVVWAVTAVRAPQSEGDPVHTSSSRPTPKASVTSTPTPVVTPTQTAQPNAVPATRVLAALDANTAWRAQTGACPATAASPELTTDGGANWKQSDASGPTGASSILTITVVSNTQADAVALAAQGCSPEFIRTYVSGDNWAAYPTQLAGTWYANPASANSVHSPTGDKTAPCPTVVGLAPQDGTNAAVLCADHSVFRTADAGATWGTAVKVSGAVAIGASGAGYAVAATGDAACAGIAIANLDATTSPGTNVGCFTAASPAPGTVVLAGGGGTLWMWAGDTVARSSNGGASWQ
jgi:hypothetical protein